MREITGAGWRRNYTVVFECVNGYQMPGYDGATAAGE